VISGKPLVPVVPDIEDFTVNDVLEIGWIQ
jgi:hypothetical protein